MHRNVELHLPSNGVKVSILLEETGMPYGASELVGIENFPNVQRVLAAFLARPAVMRGLAIPKRD